MTETGWQAIGRIARLRRERLGLKQEEIAAFGGPGVSTVGKFERAAQESFPPRTQQQIEKALGWRRTTIEQVVRSIDEGRLTADDWEHDLVEEDVPDLTPSPDFEEDRGLKNLGTILELVPPNLREEAIRRAGIAMLQTGQSHPYNSDVVRRYVSDLIREAGNRVDAAADLHAEKVRRGEVAPEIAGPASDMFRDMATHQMSIILSEPSDTTETSMKAAHEEDVPIERGQGHDDFA